MEESCRQLVASGNWQRVGASDIKLFLDMYVQSLLLRLAQAEGSPSDDLLRFIAQVPGRDVLSIGRAKPRIGLEYRAQEPLFCRGHAVAAALLCGDG